MSEVETNRPAKVFLSYASPDKSAARDIADALRKSEVSAWFDEWDLASGDSFKKRIETAVVSSDYVLLLLSPAAVDSDWVQSEVNFALITGIERQGHPSCAGLNRRLRNSMSFEGSHLS